MLFVPAVHVARDLDAVRRRGDGYRAAGFDGRLLRLRPGVFVSEEEWNRAWPEGQVVARARALSLKSQRNPVFSHETAAALHGLPLYRPHPNKVHVTLPDSRPGSAEGTIRHRAALADDESVEVGGVISTSFARTVADIARTATFAQAVTVTDAALRRIAVRASHRYDGGKAAQFRSDVTQIAARSAHGVRRAERVLNFADGRAQLPGESVSRIRLAELGFSDIRLQTRVPALSGSYYVDFAVGIGEHEWLGEFDGRIKYSEEDMRSGRTVMAVLDEEKQREDWIRGVTQRPLARWGWRHIESAQHLGARLRAFGISVPR